MPRRISASGCGQWRTDRAQRKGQRMIEGFEPSSLVIVNLVNPKEKFFGVLKSLSAAGVTINAINLDSFDDWIRQVARAEEEPDLDLLTMFVPLFRVERIFLDEPTGSVKSYGQRFEQVAGVPLRTFLGMDTDAAH